MPTAAMTLTSATASMAFQLFVFFSCTWGSSVVELLSFMDGECETKIGRGLEVRRARIECANAKQDSVLDLRAHRAGGADRHLDAEHQLLRRGGQRPRRLHRR